MPAVGYLIRELAVNISWPRGMCYAKYGDKIILSIRHDLVDEWKRFCNFVLLWFGVKRPLNLQ